MAGLFQRILAGASVQNKDNLMWGVWQNFIDRSFYFIQFIHQMDFVVQSSCRIDNYHIHIFGNCTLHRIKGNCAGVRTHGVFYDRNIRSLTPDGQLVYGRCPKSIRSAQQN